MGLRRDGDACVLTVSGNGAGLPGDVDWKKTRLLGLRIVDLVGRQLGARIDVDRSRGTQFRFAFSERK